MANLTTLLAGNARHVETFDGGDRSSIPRLRLAILTCMDARVDPRALLGLERGDAHVIRNAGGRASDDAIRSLALSRALLGVETALVIHHTDCALRGVDADRLRASLTQAGAEVPPDQDMLPLPPDIATGVRADVARLQTARLIPPGLMVHGLIYDVRTGRLEPVLLAEGQETAGHTVG